MEGHRIDVPRSRLFVVVDTEEEFDWNAPFDRSATSVRAMTAIGRGQAVFDAFDLKPTYVADFPVVDRPEGAQPLRELLQTGRCHVGAHLHPWVNPPHDEPVTAFNSFACNLPDALEAAKLRALHARIGEVFGVSPVVYKAGRYGLARRTLRTLAELGFLVDNSVIPHMNFSEVGGPDFRGSAEVPHWIAPTILEMPCTTGFAGLLSRSGEAVHDLASRPQLARWRAVGVLARLKLLNRINLSPETSTLAEMIDLTRALYRRGVRCFTLTYHSPSLAPGHTPYVNSGSELSAFLDRIRGYCDFFFGTLEGTPGDPLEYRASLLRHQEHTSA
jgi:hypothetical protein